MIKVYHSDQHKVACVLNTETEEILTVVIQPMVSTKNTIEKLHLSITSSNSDNIISIYYDALSNAEVNVAYNEVTNDLDIVSSMNDGNCNLQYRINKDYTGMNSKITYEEMINNFLQKGNLNSSYNKELVKPSDVINTAMKAKDHFETDFFSIIKSNKKKKNNDK